VRIEDLPRLTDEDREALDDGYVAIQGVAAPFVPRSQRGGIAAFALLALGALSALAFLTLLIVSAVIAANAAEPKPHTGATTPNSLCQP
jgi:hypothetical protein